MAGGGVGYGVVPPLRFADGGSTEIDPNNPYNNPVIYKDLWNTWGTSAQDTYDRVIRLLTSPEYKAWFNSLAGPTQAHAVPHFSNPNDPELLYRAQQEMQSWEIFNGRDPWTQPPPGSGGGGGVDGGGGTNPPPGGGTNPPPGGGTNPPPGGGGGGGGGTTPPPGGGGGGGGGTTPPPGGGGGGGNWGGGGGQQNPYTPPPIYTPPEFPNLAFGYPWIPEELKALRAQLGLVPGGGGISTTPPAVSTEEAEAKAGGIMSLMGRNR